MADEDLSNWNGCPVPEVPVIEGRHVAIRPFAGHGDGLALWDAFGGTDANELIKYFPNPVYERGSDFADWLVSVQENWRTAIFARPGSGEVIGMASYMRIDAANGSVEVGAVAHGPAMQRSPASTEAQYLLAAHVFDMFGYRRYEWKCHNENEPSKRTAIRLGFSFEGVFRQHLVVKGRNRDTAWYSMIDKEWPALRRAFEGWLDPDNFDGDGKQIRRLEDMRSN